MKIAAILQVYDVGGEEHDDLLSVGGDDDFIPDDTGRGLNKVRSKATLTKVNSFVRWVNSLVEAGFPLNQVNPHDVTPLIGLHGHFLRTAVDFKGVVKKNDRPTTVLLCTKILQLPGGGKKDKGKTMGKGKAVDAGLAETMAGIVQGVLIESDGEISKKDLLSTLFKNVEVNALDDKTAALKIVTKDPYLKGRDEWTFEDGVLKMA